MGRKSSVLRLPEPLREELDRRLRASSYGDIDEHALWLSEAAQQPISRSSVHRYAAALRTTDLMRGLHSAQVGQAMQNKAREGDARSVARKAFLQAELGRLALYQRRLLDELGALSAGDPAPVIPE